MLSLLLAAVVFAAAATPCPPLPDADANGSAHELSVRAKCPCSCSEDSAPASSSTHLDFAIERDEACAALPLAWIAMRELRSELPPAPFAGHDSIPI
jgi:hypothetical protein